MTQPDEIVYNLYYITLVFVILGAPMLGLPFTAELSVSFVTLATYLITAIFVQGMLSSIALLFANSFFLFGASLIGTIGAYIGELNNRRDYLQRQVIDQEHALSESLLLNILPVPIALRLKRGESVADFFPSASVLFADIANFTPLSAQMTPVELVALLNKIFSHFDGLVDRFRLDKIKTIGDCYMVASGVPVPREDHAIALVQMALEMHDYANNQDFLRDQLLSFRIGIHSGPLVAGVIGQKKFIYDLWGGAVNTASRMESHAKQGGIQITRATYELVKGTIICQPLGIIQVKGKGEMEVWNISPEDIP